MAAPAAPATALAAPAEASSSSFERGGWSFEARRCPIWSSDRADQLARELQLCKVPDMFCGDAGPPGEPLLGRVQCEVGPRMSREGQVAGRWKPRSDIPDVVELEATSDWTCSTPYWGGVVRGGGPAEEPTGGEADGEAEELPWELLRRQDEIHWYDEVLFWEDELSDFGLCRSSVRVRVMPTFWFALLLCELRVDNVLLREVATRFYCSLDADHMLREWTWREASYEALRRRGVAPEASPHVSQCSSGTALLGPEDVRRQLRQRIPLWTAGADRCGQPAAASRGEGEAGAGRADLGA
ncbi:unnamed protein product [Prorocentrum cordatum]|uniref:TIP41-like protein n=1 Tax=Prorocentrum cordatum TaxID=2364126 RepID=A0ABN9S7V7_9DINO|nr:unnamed protein product [Polarella glacialis]